MNRSVLNDATLATLVRGKYDIKLFKFRYDGEVMLCSKYCE